MAKILELGENGVFHRKEGGLLMTRELDNNRFIPYPFRVICNSFRDEIDINGDSTEVGVNVPLLDYRKKYVAPIDNSFYEFNDTLGIIPINYVFGYNNFSISVKIKTDDLVNDEFILSGVTDCLGFYISSGKLRIIKTGGTALSASTTTLLANTTYTVGYTKIGSVGTYYLNGIADGTTTDNNDYTVATTIIGKLTESANGYYIVQIDNRGLLPSEMLDRFNGLPIPSKYKGANNVNQIKGVDVNFGTNVVDIAAFNIAYADWVSVGLPVISVNSNILTMSSTIVTQGIKLLDYLVTGNRVRLTVNVSSTPIGSWEFSLFIGGSYQAMQALIVGENIVEFEVPVNTNGALYINSSTAISSINIDSSVIDNSFLTLGNTLNLSTGKTASTWYDLDHDTPGAVTGAILNDSTDFGNNVHETEECPVLLTEPSFTNRFLNSRTPVTQTITTVVGEVSTINFKGKGIATISETGGNGRGGSATEVNPFTYTPTATSVVVTLVGGHSFETGALTDTEYPMNHVETLGVSITKAKDQVNSAGDVNTFDSTAGVLEVEIAALFDTLQNRRISISDGTTTNRIYIGYSTVSNHITFLVSVDGVASYSHSETVTDITDSMICKLKWSDSDFGVKINGIEVDSQLSGVIFAANVLTTSQLDSGAGSLDFFARTKNIKTFKGIESY